VKNILPYRIFEGVDTNEVEDTIRDICSDFMDEYDLVMDFSWGYYNEKWPTKYLSRREMTMIRGSKDIVIKNKMDEINTDIKQANTSLEVSFHLPHGFSKLELYKDGINEDYKNMIGFIGSYFNEVASMDRITEICEQSMAIRFFMKFKK
jgi:hypothetical protein